MDKRQQAIEKIKSMPDNWTYNGKTKNELIEFLEKENIDSAVLVWLRAMESPDRRTILLQGDSTTGYYGQQYGVKQYSPIMDLTHEDIYRFFSVFDWHINAAYEKMYDAGIPLVKMRIGSLINSHAGSSVNWLSSLDPGTYAKVTTRIDGVDFTSNYGGKSGKSKYISIPQIKPFNDGRPNKAQSLAIELLDLEFKTYEE